MKPEKKRSFWERYALKKLTVRENAQDDEDLYQLTDQEIQLLKSIRLNTYIKAGLAGILGVVLLYIPYYIWKETLFPERMFNILFINQPISLEIEFLIFSLILVILEIWYLTYINIQAVDQISKVCGSPNPNDPDFHKHIEDLIQIGLDKKKNELKKLGINPYDGLSKWGVILFQSIIRLKATISGYLWKIVVGRILGRYAFRLLVDLLGAPIYAFWNILGARKIMNRTRARVMAPPLIHNFTKLLIEVEQKEKDINLKKALINALQIIATSKRAFHYNHYLLASSILHQFELTIDPEKDFDKDFINKMHHLAPSTKKITAKLIVFGIIIDGKLSILEKRTIDKMSNKNIIPYSYEKVKKWSKDYFEGRGLNEFFVS